MKKIVSLFLAGLLMVGATGCGSKEAMRCEHSNVISGTIQQPTCTQSGIVANTCMKCEEIVAEIPTPLAPHNYAENTIQVRSCDLDGIVEYKCTECGDSYEVKIEKTGHNYILKYNGDGTHSTECTNCGRKNIEECTMEAQMADDALHVKYVCKVCDGTKVVEDKKGAKNIPYDIKWATTVKQDFFNPTVVDQNSVKIYARKFDNKYQFTCTYKVKSDDKHDMARNFFERAGLTGPAIQSDIMYVDDGIMTVVVDKDYVEGDGNPDNYYFWVLSDSIDAGWKRAIFAKFYFKDFAK